MSNAEAAAGNVRFAWCSSFLGCIEYEVYGDGPTYRIEVRQGAGDYERSIFNGTEAEWQRDCVAAIGLVTRRNNVEQPLNPSLVADFNDWRARQHDEFVHQLRMQPERYGVLEDQDPLLKPPAPVRGAHYEIGVGWVVAAH